MRSRDVLRFDTTEEHREEATIARAVMACLLGVLALTLEADSQIHVRAIEKYVIGMTGLSAAEIAAFDPESKRLFSANDALGSTHGYDVTMKETPSSCAR